LTLGLFFEGTGQGVAGESAAVCAAVSEAVERKSERMDTAYSPRLHEEELSATASQIVPRFLGDRSAPRNFWYNIADNV